MGRNGKWGGGGGNILEIGMACAKARVWKEQDTFEEHKKFLMAGAQVQEGCDKKRGWEDTQGQVLFILDFIV